jgi:hypothetical protein
LADHYEGKKFNSPNDVLTGPDGALYFTDPSLDLVAGQKQEKPFQGVYRLDDKGSVRTAYTSGSTLYITATTSAYRLPTKVRGYDWGPPIPHKVRTKH